MAAYAQAILATLLFAANLCVNIPIIALHFQSPSMRDDMVAKVMASLCISDLWLGSVLPAIAGAVAWIDPETVPTWVITLQGFIATAFTVCSNWHLALLAIFRCSAIVYPLTYFRVFTDRSMSVMLVILHVIGPVLELISIMSGVTFAFDYDIFLPYGTSKVYASAWLSMTYAPTCVVILLCYLKIFLVVRNQVRLIHPMAIRSGIQTSGEIVGSTTGGSRVTNDGGGAGAGGGGGAGGARTQPEGDCRRSVGGNGVGSGRGSDGTKLEVGKGGDRGGGTKAEGSVERTGAESSPSALTLFANSVRSSRNLFIMSVVYLATYLPGVFAASRDLVPLGFRFAFKWLYLYASLGNGLLYIVLHKAVRRQMAKLITRWRLAASDSARGCFAKA